LVQRASDGFHSIGLVRRFFYQGKSFHKWQGFKSNYIEVESRDLYWISGPRKDGEDGLYGHRPTPIDDDVREEYWTVIRKQPEKKNRRTT
jgi:hypothetical protein